MCVVGCLVVWLFGFYDISTYVVYLTQDPFLYKQFSLAWVHSLIVKNIYITSYSV